MPPLQPPEPGGGAQSGGVSLTDRWRLSAFGDEVAADLDEQLRALAAEGIGHIELRSAWSVNVVDMDAAQLDRAARELADAGIGVSAIGSPGGKAPIDGDPVAEPGRLRAAPHAAERLGTGPG